MPGPVGGVRRFALLAAGVKSGRIWLWRLELPAAHSLANDASAAARRFALVRRTHARFHLFLHATSWHT